MSPRRLSAALAGAGVLLAAPAAADAVWSGAAAGSAAATAAAPLPLVISAGTAAPTPPIRPAHPREASA
jgi:hypothetical protein